VITGLPLGPHPCGLFALTLGLPLGPATLQPLCLGREPKARVATFPIQTRQKRQEGKERRYYPSEIRRSMDDRRGRNAQSSLCDAQEKKIINMCHILSLNLIQKMCDKVLKTH
jgi:hypothetical protein